MKNIKQYGLFFILLTLLFSGCGGSSSSNDTPIQKTGILIDNIVSGVKYINGENSGYTNEEGKFPYKGGKVEFFIGNIKLGEINSLPEDKKIFVQDIVGIDRKDTSNEKVLKIATLLQSLDSNPSTDEIEILESDFNKFNNINENITNVDLNALLPSLNFNVKPQDEVKKHVERVLVHYKIIEDTQAPILNSTNKTFTTIKGTPLNLPEVTANDNIDNTITVTQSGSVDFNKIGTYTITYTAKDKAENSSSITHTYIVKKLLDTQAPILSSTNKTFTTTVGTTLTLETVSANDNIDETVTVTQSGSVDFNKIGTYTITYTAKDKAENSSSITHTYIVEELITYSWTVGDWGSCSGSCGTNNAIQTRTVTCQSSKGKTVADTYCNYATKPNSTQNCTASLCNIAPAITSNSTISVAENQKSVLTVKATDLENDNITFSISGGADQGLFSITNSGILTFNSAPDFENPTDANTDNKYIVEVTATDDGNPNESVSQTITVSVTNIGDHYVLNAVYDDKRTAKVTDDILYLYMNQSIKQTTFNVDSSLNYDIVGTGEIGSSSANAYADTLFHRHKIELNNTGTQSTAFIESVDTIKIKANQIEDASGVTTTVNVTAMVEKFNPLARLKTGQTTCYDDRDPTTTIDCSNEHALKSDAWYASQNLHRSYTDNSNGTVTDNATGLIWQKKNDDIKRSWVIARIYCGSLTLGVSSDWRLPTIEELVSIIDKGKFGPATNAVFTNTHTEYYWSSTTYAEATTSSAWVVGFNRGGNLPFSKVDSYYVRCVSDN